MIAGVVMYIQLQVFGTAVQWNPSNPDTLGTAKGVLFIEVSLFQGCPK